ncbi:hypothetical protein M3Y99_01639900 [Aphelenchoides fujianensis]|nr:hypothetical protein M3Y99_01639900 [Aphelenchoides fujianensis]
MTKSRRISPSQNPNNGAGNVDTPVGSDYTLVDEVASWMSASYGEDAKTAEEMLHRRRQAIKIRNEQLFKICGSVIAAVSTSVGNSIRKTGPSARPERDYRIDETIPTSWDAYAIQNGKLLAYQFPRSVQDVVNDVPLDRCRPEIARIQMTADPFAKGTERLAYYARGLQTRRDVVLKDYRRLMSAGTERRQHEFANKLQTITSYFAALYMADCEEAS